MEKDKRTIEERLDSVECALFTLGLAYCERCKEWVKSSFQDNETEFSCCDDCGNIL